MDSESNVDPMKFRGCELCRKVKIVRRKGWNEAPDLFWRIGCEGRYTSFTISTPQQKLEMRNSYERFHGTKNDFFQRCVGTVSFGYGSVHDFFDILFIDNPETARLLSRDGALLCDECVDNPNLFKPHQLISS